MMKFAQAALKHQRSSALLAGQQRQCGFATLVLSEHFEGKLSPTLGAVLSAAADLKDSQVDVLVHGDGCDA